MRWPWRCDDDRPQDLAEVQQAADDQLVAAQVQRAAVDEAVAAALMLARRVAREIRPT